MFPWLDMIMQGIMDPTTLATTMAQTGISPQGLMAGAGNAANSVGNLMQPQVPQVPQAPQVQGTPQGGPTAPTNDFNTMLPLQPPGSQVADASNSIGNISLPTDPAAIRNQFVGTLQNNGVTNPYGLAAIESTAQHESSWLPQNAYGTWNDGKNPAGGIMSWNGDRLTKLQAFAQSQGEDPSKPSPATQAKFLLQEDPGLIKKLNNAKSVEEAQSIINDAWRFKGFDNPQSPESMSRLTTAQSIAANGDMGLSGGGGANQGNTSTLLNPTPIAQQNQPVTGSTTNLMQPPSALNVAQQTPPQQTLGQKLAQLGQAIKPPEAQQPYHTPITGGLGPRVGSNYQANPQVLQAIAMMLGMGGATGNNVPSLGQLIHSSIG